LRLKPSHYSKLGADPDDPCLCPAASTQLAVLGTGSSTRRSTHGTHWQVYLYLCTSVPLYLTLTSGPRRRCRAPIGLVTRWKVEMLRWDSSASKTQVPLPPTKILVAKLLIENHPSIVTRASCLAHPKASSYKPNQHHRHRHHHQHYPESDVLSDAVLTTHCHASFALGRNGADLSLQPPNNCKIAISKIALLKYSTAVQAGFHPRCDIQRRRLSCLVGGQQSHWSACLETNYHYRQAPQVCFPGEQRRQLFYFIPPPFPLDSHCCFLFAARELEDWVLDRAPIMVIENK